MLPIEMSRAQQSRAHLLTLKGLNGSMDFATNPQEAASAALAEMVALYSNGLELAFADVFTLAEAVLAYRDEKCGCGTAHYDVLSLHKACGSKRLASMALRLCGAYPEVDTGRLVDGGGEQTVIKFPPDFWKNHRLLKARAR